MTRPNTMSMSRRCPVCQSTSVRTEESTSWKKPPGLKCASCGAALKAAFTSQSLWLIPLVAVAELLALKGYISWIGSIQDLSSTARGALNGAGAALAIAIAGRVVMRGMIYKVVKE